jgi:hypothetical protein
MPLLTARPGFRGRSVELRASVAGLVGSRAPGLRVLRQRNNPALEPGPGFVLFDAQRQLGDGPAPAVYARRVRGLTPGGVADAGMWEFDLWEAHADVPVEYQGITHPTAVHCDMWVGGALLSFRLTGITHASFEIQQFGQFTVFRTVYYTPSTTSQAMITTQAGDSLRSFRWTDEGGVDHVTHYEIEETWQAPLTVQPLADGQYSGEFTWTRAGVPVLSGALRNAVHHDEGGWQLDVTLADSVPSTVGGPPGLEPAIYFYYSLHVDPAPGAAGPVYPLSAAATASALATERYGGAERLYAAVPAVDRNYDEPEPKDQGLGQLRRFLSIFGAAEDHLRGLADGLALRNDPLQADMKDLQALAHGVGWDIDRSNPGELQRDDVLLSTRVFEIVGTLPSLRVLIPRATAWPFTIREFADNVFVTNAGPNLRWDIWTASSVDGHTFGQSVGAAAQLPPRLAGRPCQVVGDFGQRWLFWHAAVADGRRELWVRWPTDVYPPRRVMAQAPDALPGDSYTDESPAVLAEALALRLYWSSDRGGAWNIWSRALPRHYQGFGLPVDKPQQLTFDPVGARSPAVAREPGPNGRCWLFWESARRGVSDIWARAATQHPISQEWIWDTARRVTTATHGDHTPAAVIDGAGKLRLYWSSLTVDGARLFESILAVGDAGQDVWGPPVEVAPAPDLRCRDESPAVVLHQGALHLYWHSNRNGSWQLWGAVDSESWGPAFQVVQGFPGNSPPPMHMVGAKEPAVVVQNNALHLSWRAQKAGEPYRSITFNTDDAAAVAALDQANDWNHYIHDAGRELSHWYAYDTVGVHFTPPEDLDPELVQRQFDRVKTFVETHRPATVRIIWFAGMTPKA